MFLHQHFNGSAQKLHVVVLTPHPPEGYNLPYLTSQQRSRIAIVQGCYSLCFAVAVTRALAIDATRRLLYGTSDTYIDRGLHREAQRRRLRLV